MRRKMKAIVNIVLIGLVLLFATGYRFNSQYANSGMRGHMSGPNVSNLGDIIVMSLIWVETAPAEMIIILIHFLGEVACITQTYRGLKK
ncbi:hypothetical protein BW727_101941 [Jeotgalibaca dankookensis]|uniref:Uncharacterized protein n=1 Tax=Jeotgalibaca dankookensis TaxID=708126 RepID=A0A1S6IRT9_9LACT|nr:hypothetical protein [Jeotgalibaca dankookensis]AQS54265.1 hypothetical protein BW727_101941 [Jeotgalibaca dankookensis]